MKNRYEKRRQLCLELQRTTGCYIQYGGFPCGTCLNDLLRELKAKHPDKINSRTWDAVFRLRGDYTPSQLEKQNYNEDFIKDFRFTDKELTEIIDNLLAVLHTTPDIKQRIEEHKKQFPTVTS